MPHEANHSPHSAYGINYHLVWIPRYRKKVLVGPVEARLKELLAEIAMQYGFEILAVEVMPDHVHLFVSAPAKFSPAEIVRLFKGITSRRLKKEFESLRRQYWGTNATLVGRRLLRWYGWTRSRGNHQTIYRGKSKEISFKS